ncbi:unnamed protein product [Sympodiomycopsis kandeliae]
MTRLLITLLPLVLAALALSVSAKEASSDPLKDVLSPDPAGPLGGTLTGLKYTGFGLTHVKRDGDAGLPEFDASTVQKGASDLAQGAMKVGSGAVPAIASDLTSQGKQAQSQVSSAGKNLPSPDTAKQGLDNAEKGLDKAGGNIHIPGGTLSDALKGRAGPQIDGMDLVSLGSDKPPSPEQAFGMVATVGKTAAGTVLSPYLNTVKTGVSAGNAVIDGADQAVGAAKQAAAKGQGGAKGQAPASALKGRAGPQIDGMDVVSLGSDKPPSPEQAFGMVATVGKTAAGTVLSPYLNTVKTGVSAGNAVIDGADQAVGAGKQAAAKGQAAAPAAKQQKRVYTPALALFPGAGPEANELGNQLKNTLGLPTPDEPAKKTPGQKRFHAKRSGGRRHP